MSCESAGKKLLMPPGYFLLAIILMVLMHLLLPGKVVVDGWYRLLGALPLMFGITANLLADKALKVAQTPVSPFAKTTTLITWGIFRWTRNPMYLGAVCILIGIWILLGSLSPAFIPILFILLMSNLFIKPEEGKLSEEFTETWIGYAKDTRRWL